MAVVAIPSTPARTRWLAPVPYVLLALGTLPILVLYVWLFYSSFFPRVEGFTPVGAFTFENWRFLWDPLSVPQMRNRPPIVPLTINTFLFASLTSLFSLLVSSMAGYAQSRSMAACLPVQLQRGGDERGMALPYDPTSSFYAVWFDAPLTVRRDYERNLMLTQLHILSALEAAGLATMEKAKPGTVNGQPVSSGVRFDVKPEALEPLGLRGNACMAVGRIGKVELAGFAESSPNNVRVALRGEVTQVQPWAQALAQWLPALKALLEEGVPFIGQIVFSPVYDRSSGTPGETKWHLSGLSPAYPQVQFTSVPPALQPLLPLTTQASLKPVRALGGFSSVPMAIPPSQAIPAPSQMIAPRVQVAPAPGSPMRAVPAPSRP